MSFKDYQYFVDFRPKKKKIIIIIKAKQIDRNVMLVIDYISGWICSISFSQNRNVPSSFIGLLKKKSCLHGDAE